MVQWSAHPASMKGLAPVVGLPTMGGPECSGLTFVDDTLGLLISVIDEPGLIVSPLWHCHDVVWRT